MYQLSILFSLRIFCVFHICVGVLHICVYCCMYKIQKNGH